MREEERLKRDAGDVDEADLSGLLSRWPRLERVISRQPRLQPFVEDVRTVYDLLRDYAAGRYRSIPWGSIAFIVAALLYVLNPLDAIPDVIPFAGFIDDASVLALCWRWVKKDIDAYRNFIERQNDSPEPNPPGSGDDDIRTS